MISGSQQRLLPAPNLVAPPQSSPATPPPVPQRFSLGRCLTPATAWHRFGRLPPPLLRPAIVMVVLMRTMVALTAFAAIFTVTGGGPGTATELLNLYAYRKSFTEMSIGDGPALSVGVGCPSWRRGGP